MIRYVSKDGIPTQPIAKCDGKRTDLLKPREYITNNNRIDIDSVIDNTTFINEYYTRWILPCIKFGRIQGTFALSYKYDNAIKALFCQDNDSNQPSTSDTQQCTEENPNNIDGSQFIEEFKKTISKLTDTAPETICDVLPSGISELNNPIMLRIKTLCLFLNETPDNIFSNGIHWLQKCISVQNKIILSTNELIIYLSPYSGNLYPGVLFNAENKPHQLKVVCENHPDYCCDIVIPPQNGIYALFKDEKRTKPVCIKSNISFAPISNHTAVVINGENRIVSIVDINTGRKNDILTDAIATDAATYGGGKTQYITSENKHKIWPPEKTPYGSSAVAVFGAGRKWCILCNNGNVIGDENLPDKVQYAFSVVGFKDEALCFANEYGYFKYEGINLKKIDLKEFFESMTYSFKDKQYFEVSESSYGIVKITKQSEIEVSKK